MADRSPDQQQQLVARVDARVAVDPHQDLGVPFAHVQHAQA